MSRTFSDSLDADLGVAFFNVAEFAKSYSIRRGQQETSGVAAIVVSREYEAPQREGAIVNVRSLDLDFVATDYAIAGEAVDPQRGDVIVDEDTEEQYEVLPLSGRQCWDPADDGRVIRVHVKQVS